MYNIYRGIAFPNCKIHSISQSVRPSVDQNAKWTYHNSICPPLSNPISAYRTGFRSWALIHWPEPDVHLALFCFAFGYKLIWLDLIWICKIANTHTAGFVLSFWFLYSVIFFVCALRHVRQSREPKQTVIAASKQKIAFQKT